jgi:SAM-dependent methyltransferase
LDKINLSRQKPLHNPMQNPLLNEDALEWSPIVANNTMNRERKATGVNSYEKDIKLNPINFLEHRRDAPTIEWMDLCCGRGNALIEVAKKLQSRSWFSKTHLTGIDLVDFFSDKKGLENLTFQQLNLAKWQPQEGVYDLITIVHGLHYLGDKIGLILKAAASLKKDGVFIGNLDIKNIEIRGCKQPEKTLKLFFEKEQINYSARTKIIKIVGEKIIKHPFIYCGANDKVGANYTGQSVVNSIYTPQYLI